MNCERARAMMLGAEGGLRVALHLLHCPACRAEAGRIRALDSALQTLPRHAPPEALLAKVLAAADSPSVLPQTKESHMKRRVLLAAAAMVVIAALAAVVVPGRHGTRDAKTIFASVAQAMENVTSLYMGGRVSGGKELMPGLQEMWMGERAQAVRYYDKGAGKLMAAKADLDTKQWWFYDGRTKALYRADLTPVWDKAEKAVPRLLRFYRSGGLTDRFLKNWPHIKHEMAVEKRDGGDVGVLTFFFEQDLPGTPPQHVIDREVFEINLADDSLLAQRRYFKYPDGTERIIEDLSTITYNTPVPEDKELLAEAKQVPEVAATVLVDQTQNGLYLRLAVDGKPINEGSAPTTMEVPRG